MFTRPHLNKQRVVSHICGPTCVICICRRVRLAQAKRDTLLEKYLKQKKVRGVD
jgi:hypothetical protein